MGAAFYCVWTVRATWHLEPKINTLACMFCMFCMSWQVALRFRVLYYFDSMSNLMPRRHRRTSEMAATKRL